MSWLAARFDLSSPVFWLFISAAIAILATNVAWLVAHLSAQRPPSTGLRWLRSNAVRAAAWLLASLWLLVLPFYAWRYAAISPALLGIAEIDWAESLGVGGLLAGLIMALTVFGWLVYRHALPTCADTDVQDSRLLLALAAAAEAGLLQWHLAFYRAALIAWLSAPEALLGSWPAALLHAAQDQSFYWGSWLGLALILVEAGLNPFVRDALATPSVAESRQGRPEALLRTLALLIATTALFLLTRNFWLSLACHVVVNTAIAGWLPLYRPARPEVLDATHDQERETNAPGACEAPGAE